jgi:hypothetical protein
MILMLGNSMVLSIRARASKKQYTLQGPVYNAASNAGTLCALCRTESPADEPILSRERAPTNADLFAVQNMRHRCVLLDAQPS